MAFSFENKLNSHKAKERFSIILNKKKRKMTYDSTLLLIEMFFFCLQSFCKKIPWTSELSAI